MGTIAASIIAFLILTLLLVTLLLVAKAKLLPSGNVHVKINGEKDIEVAIGDSLLSTLSNNKIFSSSCGKIEVKINSSLVFG